MFFFEFQTTSLVGGQSTGDLVTWSNLFAGGIKNQNDSSGIITMEDDEDEEELSDQGY